MRKLIGPFLFSLVAFVILIALGVWQVKRLHWKEGLLADIAAAQVNPPVPLAQIPRQFTKVVVNGTWDQANAVLYGTDVRIDKLGSFLVEPLLRPNQPPVMVDRGFVPDGWKATDVPGAAVSVVGYIRNPDRMAWWSVADDPAERHFYTLNPVNIAARMGMTQPEPYVLVSMGDSTAYPEPSHDFPTLPNNHLSYALTWFSLALVDMVMFVLAARKTLRE